MDIKKEVSSSNEKTKVSISLSGLEENEIAYVYFDKSIAKDLSKIKFDKENVIILDKDPLIGFRGETIDYEIEGNTLDTGILLVFSFPMPYWE